MPFDIYPTDTLPKMLTKEIIYVTRFLITKDWKQPHAHRGRFGQLNYGIPKQQNTVQLTFFSSNSLNIFLSHADTNFTCYVLYQQQKPCPKL